jgi:hypothetical protein
VRKYCDIAKRNNYDTSWICCEGSEGYPVSHVLAPMAVMLLTNDFWFSIAADTLWEVLEALGADLPFPRIYNNEADFETTAGSLIGDVMTCGVPGITLALLMIQITGWRGLRRDTIDDPRVKWKYVLIAVVLVGLWLLPILNVPNGLNYGMVIAAAVSFFLVLFALPPLMQDSDVAPYVPLCDKFPHEEALRVRWWWAAAILVIAPTCAGWIYLYNEFFGLWVSVYAFMAVELAVLAWRHWRPRAIKCETKSY